MTQPQRKSRPKAAFSSEAKITSSREQPGLQALREQQGLQVHLREPERRQQPEQEQGPEQRQEPERGPEPERVLSCHKRPERLQQR